MGLFRRKPSPEQVRARQDEGIAAFWSWWLAEGRARAARAFDEGEGALELADHLSRRVHAIDPRLSFETGAGRSARHCLVVTAAGDPDRREITQRWLAAAPPADDAFEYAASRQPVADASGVSIDLEGRGSVDLRSATVEAVLEPGSVNVRLTHPAFASLPDDAQGQITFLFLDALLGEEDVEFWIGEVSWGSVPGAGARPLLDLPALVDHVRLPG